MSTRDTILEQLADFMEDEAAIAQNSLEYSQLHKTFPGRCGPAIRRIDRYFIAAAVMRRIASMPGGRVKDDLSEVAVSRLIVLRGLRSGGDNNKGGEVANGPDK